MKPVTFNDVYVVSTASHLPGEAVSNDDLDEYIQPFNGRCGKIKHRILAENGITNRYYGIDKNGKASTTAAGMAAQAIRRCLATSDIRLDDVTMLATGSSGGDVALPGFANMVQGELGAKPLETASHHGVCAAGISALKHAAVTLDRQQQGYAVVATSEFPSRMFRKSRYAPKSYSVDFDAHFLRWMLSDGAGAWLLSTRPRAHGLSLKLHWIHSRSFSGDFPLCMQVGFAEGGKPVSYLDYPSLADAENDGAFLLRQDIRLLPHLFDVGIHEYARLVKEGCIRSSEVGHFLCHYSSQKFAPIVARLLDKAGLSIPAERWYSNLQWRGNTGAASIFIMMDEFLRTRELRPGEKVLCFVPESGRFTVSFALFEIVTAAEEKRGGESIEAPHRVEATEDSRVRTVLTELADVWHRYRSAMWRTPLVQRILAGTFTQSDYVRWMESWVAQVREGSRWMRSAIANLDSQYLELREMIERHAGDEQSDYEILFEDYRRAGGRKSSIDDFRRNPGGEALNAYLYARAGERNPVGLLGAIYVIEGTGQRIIPALLPLIKRGMKHSDAFRFLAYHGTNDVAHLDRWLKALEYVIGNSADDGPGRQIVEVARHTAELYTLQTELAA